MDQLYQAKCHKCQKYGHFQRECRSKKFQSYNKGAEPSETLFALGVNVQNNDIVIDTGATSHMFSGKDLFVDVAETEMCTVKLPDRNVVRSNKRGTVVITTQAGQRQQKITVENVLYIPEIDGNCLSVPAIAKKGYQVNFDNVGCKFRKNGNLIARAELKDDTYILSSWKPAKQKLRRAAALTKMHQKLGHTGWQKVRQMQKENEAMLIAERTTDARELLNKLEAKYVPKTIAVQIERQVELLTRKLKPEETTQELLAWLEAHYAKTFQLDATNKAQLVSHLHHRVAKPEETLYMTFSNG